MRYSTRFFLAATLAAGLVTAALPGSSAAFDSTEQKCRSSVAKAGGKFAKTVLKTMTNCHKDRDKNGGGADCNDIAASDTKVKIPTAETKFDTSVAKKCTSGTPADVLYDDCPAPCAAAVPVITNFAQVVDCEICLTRAGTEAMSSNVFGDPAPSPIADEDVADCHKSMLKNSSKLFNSVIKTIAKCQATAEKGGSESLTGCTVTDFNTLVNKAYTKCEASVTDGCGTVTLPNAALDACGGTPSTLFDLTVCTCAVPRDAAQELVTNYLELDGVGGPTTTTTSTTLPGGSDPLCPSTGELVLYSKLSNQTCANNGDCTAPRTCDPTLLICTTVAELDSGWNGAGHDADINDGVTAAARLTCPGPASPGCGECTVDGLDPSPGNCRCANNILNVCDQPFSADADDCGGAMCDCYFGAPFPLSSAGTPACVSNRFSQDITGTANPDLGSGAITANLRTRVFLGLTTDMPCPVCGGKCSDDNSGCIFDSDCTNPATCVQDTPGDGVRDGLCVYDPNMHTDNGVACDSDGTNSSFPAVIGNTSGGSGGGGYSIDCQPTVGTNVSGQGLKIGLNQNTGTSSLGFGVDCDGSGVGTDMCPCLTCSKDNTQPCSSDAGCASQGSFCSAYTAPTIYNCSSNSDCASVNIGTCTALGNTRCSGANAKLCASNADCGLQPIGPCVVSSCSSKGGSAGEIPKPNDCTAQACTDQGGGEGECTTGPDQGYCDALVKADGAGINSCTNNGDCAGGYGLCTIADRADCFLDPIEAVGAADPEFPVAGATFCIPPTSNGGINGAVGLPGPGRVVNQGAATTYCTSNPAVEYNPGGVPACP